MALRLGVATLLGGAIGFEREWRGSRAGLRTHILVALGACLFTLTSVIANQYVDLSPKGVEADVTRIASQIVVGVGFLGGGAILRHGATVKGLTTAASLWVTAALGLAAGFGFFWGGVATAVISLICLVGLKELESRVFRGRRKKLARRRALEGEGRAQAADHVGER